MIILKIIQVSFISHPKDDLKHTENKSLPWQHLIKMVNDKICQMTVKGVKIKVRKYLFNILWRFGVMEDPPVGIGLMLSIIESS